MFRLHVVHMSIWTFAKFFFPYLFLLSGMVLVIAGLADIGYVPANPTCADWLQANHEYSNIVGSSSLSLPNLHLLRFSNACGIWKTWFSFGIMTIFSYFTLLIWPMAFTVGRRFMFISMEIVAAFAVFNSIMTFTFVLLFFILGGAWEWKFSCARGNPPICAFYNDGSPFPATPNITVLPWQNTSQAFRDIMQDPKFFARYALDKYGTQDTILTCIGTFLGALGAVFIVLLQNSLEKSWEPVTSAETPTQTTQPPISTPSKPSTPATTGEQPSPNPAIYKSVLSPT